MDRNLLSEIQRLKPGEGVVYHEGFLAVDRVHPQGEGLKSMAEQVYKLYQEDKIFLVQRKIKTSASGMSIFEYIAQGRAKE